MRNNAYVVDEREKANFIGFSLAFSKASSRGKCGLPDCQARQHRARTYSQSQCSRTKDQGGWGGEDAPSPLAPSPLVGGMIQYSTPGEKGVSDKLKDCIVWRILYPIAQREDLLQPLKMLSLRRDKKMYIIYIDWIVRIAATTEALLGHRKPRCRRWPSERKCPSDKPGRAKESGSSLFGFLMQMLSMPPTLGAMLQLLPRRPTEWPSSCCHPHKQSYTHAPIQAHPRMHVNTHPSFLST
mmetsp:Transcript_66190/g.110534  ORF Transcript_66190/g.110534 Transcript_66190/m.110534 type:complete len:240 (+) Transcript_66190:409-1128(+)